MPALIPYVSFPVRRNITGDALLFFSLSGQTGGGVVSEVVGSVGGVFVFFEDVGRCCGDDVFDIFGRRCDGTGS